MVVDDTSSAAHAAMKDGTFGISARGKTAANAAVGLSVQIPELSYGDTNILNNVNIDLLAGKFTCLLGPSGVGKSSIMKLITGILPPQRGTSLTTSDGKPVLGRIAYMDQKDLLLPWATILDNLVIAARLRGEKPDLDMAHQLLTAVGLQENAKSYPRELSGGMRQRVALARTLMEDTPFILVDEPFSALDAISRHRLQELTAKLIKGRTVLMITHDPMEALRLGDQVLVLSGAPVTVTKITGLAGQIPRDVTADDLKPHYRKILDLLGMHDGAAL
jgi:putative hydroxymethylpyrimidine transport system ATP-binding protein